MTPLKLLEPAKPIVTSDHRPLRVRNEEVFVEQQSVNSVVRHGALICLRLAVTSLAEFLIPRSGNSRAQLSLSLMKVLGEQ